MHGDEADDSSEPRRARRARGITPYLARRGIDSSERLGGSRWVGERTLAWLLGYHRLQRMLYLAYAWICLGFLNPSPA